jgi:capsule polysaccharide export protein KpsE/RkpR
MMTVNKIKMNGLIWVKVEIVREILNSLVKKQTQIDRIISQLSKKNNKITFLENSSTSVRKK